MTTIKVTNSKNLFNVLVALIITVAVLVLASVNLYGGSMSLKGPVSEPVEPRPALNVKAPNNASTLRSSQLSASQALATDDPVMFVFVPFEKCSQLYCLTAIVVETSLPAHLADSIHVVEVPVHSFNAHTVDTPPGFIIADWDLYPTVPQAEWMPDATLTGFGWGINETMIVLVDSDGELVHDFGQHLDIDLLELLLQKA